MKLGSIVFFKIFGKLVEATIIEFGSKKSKVEWDNKIFQVKTTDLKLSNELDKN